MNERAIRDLIEAVREGRLPRRRFIGRMVALGLTAPMASMLLAHEGIAQTAAALPPYKPQRRGGGGVLKMLSWQGVVHLNPHFASGRKDAEAARMFYEPLAGFDNDGNMYPVLAAEIPSRANGGVAADGRSVTWKLKQGVRWHDGQPFTADDVVFNWQYCRDPATGAVNTGSYREDRVEKVEKIDAHTVRVVFTQPTPYWGEQFTGVLGMILPKHVFGPYAGARSRESPNNTRPVGTGPYRLVEFRSADIIRGELNPNYHLPLRPYFDTIELKSGGDAVSAARAVLQTGEYDYGGLLGGIEDEVLKRMETGGKGRVLSTHAEWIEHFLLNASDPWKETGGERGSLKSRHPAFSDKAVRDAMVLLIDRKGIQEFLFPHSGAATANYLNVPAQYRSPNLKHEFSVAKANQLLDAAGWRRGADGIRSKGDTRLKFVFISQVNAARQKIQAIVKDACAKAGIDIEIRALESSVMFGADPANPDNYKKFWADMLVFSFPGLVPDPQFLMSQFCSWEAAQKANQWAAPNIARWRNDDYDAAFRAAQTELDPVKRAALFIRMNDVLCNDHHIIPVMTRGGVAAMGNRLVARLSSWDANLSTLAHWYREA